METFTLVAWFVLMGPHGGDFADMRVPGLMETERKMRAKEFAATPRIEGAYCAIEGQPAPAWTPPISFTLVTSIYLGGRPARAYPHTWPQRGSV